MSDTLIHCQGLQKSYGAHRVLESIDFDVKAGQLVGFLGPNGAGKTTTIRILVGLLKPSSGIAEVLGRCAQSEGDSIRRDVGYLPGDVHMYSNLTGRGMLRFMASARRLNCDEEINRLASRLKLEIDRTIRKYSTGMRQKLGLIQALMHKPRLVILDEPTSALDPLIRQTVFEELRSVVSQGRTVLFSSHSLSEVEELCDEVIILRSGKIVEQNRIEKLREKAIRRVRITFTAPHAVPDPAPKSLTVIRREESSLVGTWAASASELIQWLATENVVDVVIEKPDLSDLFLTFYDGTKS